jgi:hypothetical protein
VGEEGMTAPGDKVSVVMGSDGKYYCKSTPSVSVGNNLQAFMGSDGKWYASKSGPPVVGANMLVSLDSSGKYIAHSSVGIVGIIIGLNGFIKTTIDNCTNFITSTKIGDTVITCIENNNNSRILSGGGANGSIAYSTTYGYSFAPLKTPDTNGFYNWPSIFNSGGLLFVAGQYYLNYNWHPVLYSSIDGGDNWIKKIDPGTSGGGDKCLKVFYWGSNYICACINGNDTDIYTSPDGLTWSIDHTLTGIILNWIISDGSIIYGYMTTGGSNYSFSCNDNLTTITPITSAGSYHLFFYTDTNWFRVLNTDNKKLERYNGSAWDLILTTDKQIYSVYQLDSYIAVSCGYGVNTDSRVYLSSNSGVSFDEIYNSKGLYGTAITAICLFLM